MITFPPDHFDIFFRYYLRRRGLTATQYALMLGIDQKIIHGVYEGRLYPPEKVLREMGVLTERIPAVEKFKWEMGSEVKEI